MFQNEYLLANIGFDTTESEPSEVWPARQPTTPPGHKKTYATVNIDGLWLQAPFRRGHCHSEGFWAPRKLDEPFAPIHLQLKHFLVHVQYRFGRILDAAVRRSFHATYTAAIPDVHQFLK